MGPDNRNQQDPSRQDENRQDQQEQSSFNNPQDGRKWDNYQTRTLSSDTGEGERTDENSRQENSSGKENSGESV